MKGIEDQELTLCLNASWEVIGTRTIKETIIGMCSSPNGCSSLKALRIEYFEDKYGNIDFEETILMEPLSFEEWIELPVREHHLSIGTVNRRIRAPTVAIAVGFNKIIMKKFRPTTGEIWRRDDGICQYTGKKVTKKTGNIDHLISKKNGGKDTFENMVVACKEINTVKGPKNLEETSLKLIRKPSTPNPVPVWSLIKEAKHRDWEQFLMKK